MSSYDRVLAGEMRSAGRLMRDLDDGLPAARAVLKRLYSHTGHGRVIGITGPPGSGKSTLVDALIALYRRAGKRVGVVAVDPSSPFSGGAILGDRIRMNRHATDPGVFIRSLASRGHLGGLSRSTNDAVTVLDAMGYDPIFIETVGVGQAEVDIVEAAHVAVVVTVPGLGDEVQAIKAGILEIADLLCVNKADRSGADRAEHDLQLMLDLRSDKLPRPAIVPTVASTGKGIEALAAEIDRLGLRDDEASWKQRLLRRARRQLEDLIRIGATEIVLDHARDQMEDLVTAVAQRELDPYTAVERLLAGLFRVD